MSLDNLQDLRLFNQVVRSKGFTAAAQVLQLPVNMVSRRVSLLENRINTQLLNRTTRKISLTEEGRTLFERSQNLLEAFETLEEDLTNAKKTLSGTVRVAVRTPTIEFGFIEELSKSLKLFKNLKIQLIVTDDPVDLIADGIDLALMINQLPDSSLIQKKLGEVIFGLCASADYVRHHDKVKSPEDLYSHHFISPLNKRSKATLLLCKNEKKITDSYRINPRFQSNNISSRARAIYSGLGIGNLPIAEIVKGKKDGTLVQVLPEYTLNPIPVWSIKTQNKKNDPRLKLIEKLLTETGVRMCAN